MKSLFPALFVLAPLAAPQTTIHVPADVPTIQGAIVQAQDGDTVLVASGTYNELIDYLGKAITVASESGAAVTTIDGTGLFDSVVRFAKHEGRGSVLRGFTVTGGNGGSQPGGIYAYEATPRIEACVIRANRAGAAPAHGVFGNARLVDCVIEGNSGGLVSAGGVWGEAVLRRCVIRNNTGYDTGGVYLFGRGRAVDCVIVGNVSDEGTYGGGAYLAGPDAVLERCLVADNTAASRGQYPVSSAGVFAYSPSGPALVLNCTIVGNHVISPHVPPGEDCGGVQGNVRLVNTIVRDNDGLEIGLRATVEAAFSNIAGGHPGPGNFDQDPLFVDAPNGDYHLAAGSPCIDAGAPQAPQDPDCTRADVGAFHYAQANALVRNGTGVNPLFLSSLTPPLLGTSWQARIDSSLVPGAALSVVLGQAAALEPGRLVAGGELLIDGPTLFAGSLASSGGADDFAFAVPNLAGLVGAEAHAQGVILTSAGRVRLGNALHLKLGN